jgi:hypothetical protein
VSGLSPTARRPDPRREAQRVEAIALVGKHAGLIRSVARDQGVPPEAIAGAILWEALENPYERRFVRLGPGKVYAFEFFRRSEAQRVEDEGRVQPPARSHWQRLRRLRDPVWAIAYIAAIMRRHADVYLRIAGVDISADSAVLCTLYQGGRSEPRAERLAARRALDSSATPIPANEMGPWIWQHLSFIECVLDAMSGLAAQPGVLLGDSESFRAAPRDLHTARPPEAATDRG